ncbi:MAG: ABC transporter permease [Polyangiales bacterium]
MIGPLHRKLLRDLRDLRGPILTIAVVVACGVSAFVSLAGTHRALVSARTHYYGAQRMGDVFASAERVPESVTPRLTELPGVSRVQTRITTSVRVPMPSLRSPADGVAVSIPRDGDARLGAVRLVRGRRPRPGHDDEVLLLEAFANAHRLHPGAPLTVVIEGQERTLRVVGLGTSPEWVFAVQAGSFAPDDARFAVIWMPRPALAAVTGLEGAFNDVVLELQAHQSPAAVIDAVDRLLDPYGTPGAYGLARQPSHFYLDQELTQLEGMANFAPFLFLAVAAFLLNVVLARIVALQRGIVATLKAVGYRDLSIAWHYLELVIVIVALGAVFGLLLGALMGDLLTELYLGFYHLPRLAFAIPRDIAGMAIVTALASGVVGGLGAVRGILRMTPAEAMRPATPPTYRGGQQLPMWVRRVVSPSLRMVTRELVRQPVRTVLSVMGIALSVGLLVLGASITDSMKVLIDQMLPAVQREDLTVILRSPVPQAELSTFRAIEGVRRAEGMRALPVRFEAGPRMRAAVINGYPDPHRLRPLRDLAGHEQPIPRHGVILTDILAERLGVAPGEHVRVRTLTGARRTLDIPVAGVVSEAMGMAGHMSLAELHRLLREPVTIDQVLLSVDARLEGSVQARVDELPLVGSSGNAKRAIRQFAEQSGRSMDVFALVIALFAAAITIGVVYNNARITLNARQRDLASMRILGFTKAEIGAVLLGELTLQVGLALPFGLWLGRKMLDGMMSNVDPEAFRMPAVIDSSSYATAAVVTVVASLVAGYIVRRRLDSLDLIGTLKTRE